MKTAKIITIALLAYISVVFTFELTLGFTQPEDKNTFIITTQDADGHSKSRVLSQNMSGGKLYAAANHWPRNWYNEAIERPNVLVTIDGVAAEYLAMPVSAEEHERVNSENPNGLGLRILCGFAPREFLRLDPL